jgi:hypothetical protein
VRLKYLSADVFAKPYHCQTLILKIEVSPGNVSERRFVLFDVMGAICGVVICDPGSGSGGPI